MTLEVEETNQRSAEECFTRQIRQTDWGQKETMPLVKKSDSKNAEFKFHYSAKVFTDLQYSEYCRHSYFVSAYPPYVCSGVPLGCVLGPVPLTFTTKSTAYTL